MAYRTTAAVRTAREQRADALRSAAHGIVADGGFGAATVKAITARAGVSVGTVYTYFDNREELLVAVFQEAATVELTAVRAAVAAAAGPDDGARAARQLAALVATFAARAIRGRQLAWALLVEPVGPLIAAERLQFRRAYAETVAAIITDGVHTGELPEQDPRIVGPGVVGAIGEALTGPLSPLDDRKLAPADVVAGITDLCLQAVGGGIQ